MQHFSKLFFLFLLSLNFVAPIQNLQANSYIQQDWLAKQIDHPVLSQQDSNSNNPKITIDINQLRSRIPCPMVGKSNQPTTLQNYKFVSAPDLKTGTVQDLDLYLIRAKVTIEEALNWRAALHE